MATLLGLSRAAVSKVMATYTHIMGGHQRNSDQKPKLSERDHHILKRNVSINHRSTAAKVTTELDIHLEDRFTKTV